MSGVDIGTHFEPGSVLSATAPWYGVAGAQRGEVQYGIS